MEPDILLAIEQPFQSALQTVDFRGAVVPDAMLVAYATVCLAMVERR